MTEDNDRGLEDVVIDDHKYVTFNRAALLQLVGLWSTQNLAEVPVPSLLADVEAIEIRDAVVIRRQDYFASPALATYASCIAMTASMSDDPKTRRSLLAIADYFHRQSEIAGDEAWKIPDA